jgi:predicted DNA-binding ribbon-helix-helix protein
MNQRLIERTQTGVRLEKSLLKVLKGLAEYCDMSMGDLLEGIVLHSFESKPPFSNETRAAIDKLKNVYNCELTAADSHKLRESGQ